MNKKIKVTVTGFVNNVFIGNDVEVEKYLKQLKLQQESNVDMKTYKKEMPTFQDKHLYNGQYTIGNRNYNDPSYTLEKFRETSNPYGLNIKIETITETNTNIFF
jgi:hypothetical protein